MRAAQHASCHAETKYCVGTLHDFDVVGGVCYIIPADHPDPLRPAQGPVLSHVKRTKGLFCSGQRNDKSLSSMRCALRWVAQNVSWDSDGKMSLGWPI